ncbi:MAG: hypothetical protein ACE5EH_03585 [Gammaproteobacteria bacterium]
MNYFGKVKTAQQIETKIILCAALFALNSPALAELKDPTRPAYLHGSSGAVTMERMSETLDAGVNGRQLKLTSTFVSGKSKIAVINNQMVKKGDRLGDIVVIDIKSSAVLLKDNREDIILTLYDRSIKNPVTGNTQRRNQGIKIVR